MGEGVSAQVQHHRDRELSVYGSQSASLQFKCASREARCVCLHLYPHRAAARVLMFTLSLRLTMVYIDADRDTLVAVMSSAVQTCRPQC